MKLTLRTDLTVEDLSRGSSTTRSRVRGGGRAFCPFELQSDAGWCTLPALLLGVAFPQQGQVAPNRSQMQRVLSVSFDGRTER